MCIYWVVASRLRCHRLRLDPNLSLTLIWALPKRRLRQCMKFAFYWFFAVASVKIKLYIWSTCIWSQEWCGFRCFLHFWVHGHRLAKCLGFEQLRHSLFSLTNCNFLLCGNPLNILHPYKGCLADLQAMQVSSTQVVYKGFGGIVFSGFVVQHFRSLPQVVFSVAQARLSRNSKTVV